MLGNTGVRSRRDGTLKKSYLDNLGVPSIAVLALGIAQKLLGNYGYNHTRLEPRTCYVDLS